MRGTRSVRRPVLALAALVSVGIALFLQQGYSVVAAPAAGSPLDSSRAAFAEVSREAGITKNRVVSLDLAIGQAWGDYDNDGWVDLYVTDPAGPNTLYHNQGDGTFTVSPLREQVALATAYSAGAVFVDFDNDGWRDLFVANWGTNRLFRNEGGQGFVDITTRAGLVDTGNSKTGSWGDFDQDGFLDLYIAKWSCYPQCGRPMDGDVDRLYHNNGDGTFTDVSNWLGGGLTGAGFVASFNDYDNDGDLDLYLVNDEFINPVGNKLWRNDGPGCQGWCFTQVAEEAGAASRLFGMGLATGDYDNDGDLDYYYSNVGPMELLQNQGDGTFEEVAEGAGVQAANGIAWGTVFLDYDNDGWRDLYLAVADTTNHRDIAANPLFRNNGDGTFTRVACLNEASDVRPSLGVAYADYDKDGWVDLVVGNMDEGYRLYHNQAAASSGNHNHWLALELTGGGQVNRDAVGARAYVTTPNGVTQMQDIIAGASLGAGNELALYFGLGAATQAEVSIRWPDGTRQEFAAVASDQRYRLDYPAVGDTALVPLAGSKAAAAALPAPAVPVMSFPLPLLLAGAGVALLALAVIPGQAGRAHWGGALVVLGAAGIVGAAFLALPEGGLETLLPQSDAARLRVLMDQSGVRPPTHPAAPSQELITLGEALFWDPELSGNRDISCATCHHPLEATGDSLSVSIGTSGQGLGELRVRLNERNEFIPRNAQPLFNLGYEEWQILFWDGRVSGNLAMGFDTPASDRLPDGLDSLLAAQAMFPVTSRDEMRGLRGDHDSFGEKNELAMLVDYAARPIWASLMRRLTAIPGYVELFRAAYPDVPVDQLGFQHAANALAAYEIDFFTFEDSPFDRYIQGDESVLSPEEVRGGLLFYGEAGCATCHTGGLLTDQQFHNLAVPQVGPGKGREEPLDLGRARETGNDCDRFTFRTPPLRNVAITGPWMHSGAFTTLEGAVRHHLNPVEGLLAYDASQLTVMFRSMCQDQPEVLRAVLSTQSDIASEQAALTDAQVADLLAFLGALTSPTALHLEDTIPETVPSGLPVGGNIENQSAQATP